MGIPVLIIGESGSGKTYSIKGFDPGEVGIFLCEKNRLPFRKKFDTYKVRNMEAIDENNVQRTIRQAEVIQTKLMILLIVMNEFFHSLSYMKKK